MPNSNDDGAAGDQPEFPRRASSVSVMDGREDPTSDAEARQPAEADEEPKPLGQEAPEIVDDAAKIGGKRLDRSVVGEMITSIIGGMSVSFGVVAMAWTSASLGGADGPSVAHLVGSFAYPIGFVILLLGKSELFTENFLLPVTGVLERRGTLAQLGRLWGITFIFNLVGAAIFAFLVSRPGVLDAGPREHIVSLAEHVLGYPFWTAFVKGLFAGWLMTILTWLLLAADGIGPRLVVIWLIGTLIILGEFAHVIISGTEIFMAGFMNPEIVVTDWVRGSFWPMLAGNVVGGVIFVTLLYYVQAQYEHHSERYSGPGRGSDAS